MIEPKTMKESWSNGVGFGVRAVFFCASSDEISENISVADGRFTPAESYEVVPVGGSDTVRIMQEGVDDPVWLIGVDTPENGSPDATCPALRTRSDDLCD